MKGLVTKNRLILEAKAAQTIRMYLLLILAVHMESDEMFENDSFGGQPSRKYVRKKWLCTPVHQSEQLAVTAKLPDNELTKVLRDFRQ